MLLKGKNDESSRMGQLQKVTKSNQQESSLRQQSGLRSLHVIVTALLGAIDSWAFNIDRGYENAVVFLDLKKRH